VSEVQRRRNTVANGRRQAREYHPQDSSKAADSVLLRRIEDKIAIITGLMAKPGVLTDEEICTLGTAEFDRQRTVMLMEDRQRGGRCAHR